MPAMRLTLAVFAALGTVLLVLLAQASANTTLFAEFYPLLLAVNAVAVLALLALVAFQVRRLWRDLRAQVFGTRLKTRLLGMLALMAILPGTLVYAVSMQFAVKSIDSWFDVRVDAALEGGLSLARNVLDELQTEALAKAGDISLDLGDAGAVNPSVLNRLREDAGARTATVMTLDGRVETTSTGELGAVLPPLPEHSQLRQARGGRGFAQVSDTGGRLFVRALVPLASSDLRAEPRVLQVTFDVPESISTDARSVEAAHRDYQELQLASGGLKRLYTLTLTLTMLLAFFAAIGLAFVLAERLAKPLLILAEGTQAVAAGDFSPRASIAGSDELRMLTRSFRNMTEQLAEARREAETRRMALEAAQAYLESVLANLSAGVLAFDPHFHLRAANKGAMTILGDDLLGFERLALEDWPRHEALARAVLGAFAQKGADWQMQIELTGSDHGAQVLLLQGTALPEGGGGGYVVVFDDVSELIAAQRSAAWGEVARRLAHEIKNPLTPIQLSAERLQAKLGGRLAEADRDLLDRATHTIVTQVEAMKRMVNDFREYARLPPPQLAGVDITGLLGDVLALYAGSRAPVSLDIALPAGGTFPLVRADATQIRQVLHNLLANAQDALTGAADPAVRIELAVDGRRARLSIRDNGPGFTAEVLSRAFEPYITTKTRGTGLGLALVKKIVDDHGGEIRLSNRPARAGDHGGGQVMVWLPLVTS